MPENDFSDDYISRLIKIVELINSHMIQYLRASYTELPTKH